MSGIKFSEKIPDGEYSLTAIGGSSESERITVFLKNKKEKKSISVSEDFADDISECGMMGGSVTIKGGLLFL